MRGFTDAKKCEVCVTLSVTNATVANATFWWQSPELYQTMFISMLELIPARMLTKLVENVKCQNRLRIGQFHS